MNPFLLTGFFLISLAQQNQTPMPGPGERVLFIGDSNTYAGHFVAEIDYFLLTRYSRENIEVINLGLPSETISGLSERDHPFPRPDVNERLDRALIAIKPTCLIACYGMNDGIYSPFAEDRFAKFQQGFYTLIKKSKETGARLSLITPAPFDPKPLKGKLLPTGAPDYSYKNPFEDYDAVLTRYSSWIVGLKSTHLPVADAHSALLEQIKERRKTNPGYIFSGDGIHPTPSGHWFVARELLQAWHVVPPTRQIIVRGKQPPLPIILIGSFPYCPNPAWEAWVKDDFNKTWGPQPLKVQGLEKGKFTLSFQGKVLGKFSAEELAKGIDLQSLDLPLKEKAQRLRQLSAERTKELGQGWLDEVGHKRPMTPKGKPLMKARQIYEEKTAQIKGILAEKIELTLDQDPCSKQD